MKVITVNRRATHDYDILDRVEAGLALTGSEIKSVRAGRINLRDAYARPINGELWLVNAHIAQYAQANIYNHEPNRFRKLLLHKEQVTDLTGATAKQGLTLVPLRLYIRNHVAKVELAVARGRRKYDKRRVIARRTAEREMDRAIKRGK